MADMIDMVDCVSLDKFWEAMSPIGARFGRPHDRFIFRGQASSEWELIPKVFRTSEIEKYKQGMMSTLRDHPGQFFFEWSLLHSFIQYCDAVGLKVPGDSMEFGHISTKTTSPTFTVKPVRTGRRTVLSP